MIVLLSSLPLGPWFLGLLLSSGGINPWEAILHSIEDSG